MVNWSIEKLIFDYSTEYNIMNFETIWRQSMDGLQMCSKVEQSAKVRRN